MKTAADLIAELQALDPETIVLVGDGLDYREPVITKIASTEYGLFPGRKKVALLPGMRR